MIGYYNVQLACATKYEGIGCVYEGNSVVEVGGRDQEVDIAEITS